MADPRDIVRDRVRRLMERRESLDRARETASGIATAIDDQGKRNPKLHFALGMLPGVGNVLGAATITNPESSETEKGINIMSPVFGPVIGKGVGRLIKKVFGAGDGAISQLITGPVGRANAPKRLVHEADVSWRGLQLNEVMDDTLDKAHVVSRMTDKAGERFGLLGRPGGDDIIEAYPKLEAAVIKPRAGSSSTAYPATNTAYVGVLTRGARATEGEVEERLIHEMQHLAQHVEKFPQRFRGWSVKSDLPAGMDKWPDGKIPTEVWNKYVTNPGEIMARVASDRVAWPRNIRTEIPLDKHLEAAEGMLGYEMRKWGRILMMPAEEWKIRAYLAEITPGTKSYNPQLAAEHLENVQAVRAIWPDDSPATVKAGAVRPSADAPVPVKAPAEGYYRGDDGQLYYSDGNKLSTVDEAN